MKKILKRLKSKKGVTLVELIVVMFISSILLVMAFNMMQVSTRLMTSLTSNAHLDALCDTANEYIRSSVSGATAITVYNYNGDTTAIETTAEEYKNSGSAARAIAVLKTEATAPDGVKKEFYRLYDFGDFSKNGVDVAAQMANPSYEYAVFSNNFYENTSFNAKLVLEKVSGSAKKMSVTSQCHEYTDGTSNTIDKAEPANQERKLIFNLYSNSVTPGGDLVADDVSSFNSGNQFVILFTAYNGRV